MSRFWNHIRNAEASQEPSLAEEDVALQKARDESLTNQAIEAKDDKITIEVPSATTTTTTTTDTEELKLRKSDEKLIDDRLAPITDQQQPRPKEGFDPNRQLEEAMKEADDPIEAAVDYAIARGGRLTADGQVTTDRKKVRELVEAELAGQAERDIPRGDEVYDWNPLDEEDAKKRLGLDGIGKDSIQDLVTVGASLDTEINNTIQPLLNSPEDLDQRVSNILMSYNLVDPVTKQVYPKVSNAVAVQLIETIQDEINKRDEQRKGKYNSAYQEGVTISFDQQKDVDTTITGEKINPDYLRGSVTQGALDRLMINYDDQGGGVVTGRGGGSKNLDPELLGAIDTVFWQSIKNMGFIDNITSKDPKTGKDEESYYGFSSAADSFYNSTRDVLSQIQPEKRIDVSLTPTVGGQALPGKERYRRKVGAYSLKSMMDNNLAIENLVKDNLGRIAYKINPASLSYVETMVNSLIKVNEEGNIIGLENQSEIGFYSTSDFAAAINLDEGKWRKSQARAMNRLNADQDGITEEETNMRIQQANDQADRVMRQEARKILQTMKDMQERKNQVFYNKWFHATAVGRYFVRNTVLNPLDSKLVRMTVESPKKTIIDLTKVSHLDKGNDNNPDSLNSKMENWVYIIGKNLLNDKNTNNVSTEDMGWNSILRITREILNAGPNLKDSTASDTYKTWLATGKKLREYVNNPEGFNLKVLKEIVDNSGHANSFKKNDEWGFKLQSFIDFANWHDAFRKSTEIQSKGGNQTALFIPKARVQHDGKQSGIAIQAMQNSDATFLKKVGLIYDSEDNVIPQGDIRGAFMQNLIGMGIKSTFAGNPAKAALYADLFRELMSDNISYPNIAKDISKTPLMEVSYGKSARFNQETVVNFLNNTKYAAAFGRAFRNSGMDEKTYDRADVINDMNRLIEVTLRETVSHTHQETLKRVGLLWSMMGITPHFEGPLGTQIFLGSLEMQSTGNSITIKVPEGVIQRDIKKPTSTGSARTKKRKLQFNQETNTFERSPMSRFGQEVANQLPVLTVQHIDAAIMAETINAVDKSKFLVPIHDAILTDVDSVREYHRTINNKFKEINSRYSMQRAIRSAFVNAISEFNKKIDPDGTYLLTSEMPPSNINPHRALHSYFLTIDNQLKEKMKYKDKPVSGKMQKRSNAFTSEELIFKAKKEGWTPEGGEITGKQLTNLFALARQNMLVADRMYQWEESSSSRRRIIARGNKIENLIYEYN